MASSVPADEYLFGFKFLSSSSVILLGSGSGLDDFSNPPTTPSPVRWLLLNLTLCRMKKNIDFFSRPRTYACAYLLLIPIFALIFNFFSDDFYISNVSVDRQLPIEKSQIEEDLLAALQAKYSSQSKDSFVFLNTIFKPNRLFLDDITEGNTHGYIEFKGKYKDSITFTGLRVPITVETKQYEEGLFILLFGLSENIDYNEISPYMQIVNSYNGVDFLNGLLSPLNGDETIRVRPTYTVVVNINQPWRDVNSFKKYIKPYLVIPPIIQNKINAYFHLKKGLPSSENEGNYLRMLYLSAVTITTVGFGDIVPITNRARLAISIEAILGVVLIGMFLNSIANKIKR